MRLTYVIECRRAGEDRAECDALTMLIELRDQVQVIGLLGGFGGGRSGVISGDSHDGLSIWVRGSRDLLRYCSASPRGMKWLQSGGLLGVTTAWRRFIASAVRTNVVRRGG